MSDEYRLLFGAFAIFSALIAIKGIRAIRAGELYRFGSWEGWLFTGKVLTRMSTRMKTGLSIVIVVGCGLVAAGVRTLAFELAMGALCIMIINDFAGKKDPT